MGHPPKRTSSPRRSVIPRRRSSRRRVTRAGGPIAEPSRSSRWPLALSTEQQALNVDGDRVAAAIAVAIDADALIILTSVPGLLRDADDPRTLVPETTVHEAETLARGRMKVKILAAREAIEGGVDEVVIRSASGDPSVRTVIRS